jgi:dipeptidyl aminopeptidase/acylaminoacyl peptidase
MSEKLNATGVESDFITIEGGKHGFSGENSSRANQARLEWFQKHLLH